MGASSKKAVGGDEWRNLPVEGRLEYSLVKVCQSVTGSRTFNVSYSSRVLTSMLLRTLSWQD